MAKRYPELENPPKYEVNREGRLIEPAPWRKINGADYMLGEIFYDSISAKTLKQNLEKHFGFKVLIKKRQPKATFEVWVTKPKEKKNDTDRRAEKS